MRLVATELSYPEAIALMKDLRDAGVDCGETAGGVAIYSCSDHYTETWLRKVKEVCDRHECSVSTGKTLLEKLVVDRESAAETLRQYGVEIS